jgi:voltage-gated potassium channel
VPFARRIASLGSRCFAHSADVFLASRMSSPHFGAIKNSSHRGGKFIRLPIEGQAMAVIDVLSLRKSLAVIFEDEEPRSFVTRLVNALLAILIVGNVTAIILESVEPFGRQFSAAFDTFEAAATAVFAIEYVLRLWACVDFHTTSYAGPLWGRLRYMRSFFALVDLAAVLPAIVGIIGAADFRVLRLLRLVRMLKLIRHSTTFNLLWSVLRDEARSIAALIFVLLLTVTISGSLMYMFEGEVQPNVFTSIPVAMWWAIETLTTVGYGDFVPVTVAGRVLGGIVSIIGIGTLALFSGLITVAFIAQLKVYREKQAAVHFAASGGTSLIEFDYQTGGNGDDRPAAQTPAIIATNPAATTCPHCGGVIIPAAASGGDQIRPVA